MIIYTEEMKQIDELWSHEKEDSKKMKSFFLSIMESAKKVGYQGYYHIDYNEHSKETYIMLSNDKENLKNHDDNDRIFGNCKELINELHRMIIKQ